MRTLSTRTSVVTAGLLCIVGVVGANAATAATPTTSQKPVTRVSSVTTTAPKVALKRVSVTITAPAKVSAKTKFTETIGGVVTSGKTHLGGRTVVLEGRRTGTTKWINIAFKTTHLKTGTVTFTTTQVHTSEQYRLVQPAGKGYASATSQTVTVKRV
jgi:hypothetical protein